jgi:choline dehydrogenase-like flavoprotein
MGGLSVSHPYGRVRFGSDPSKAALNEFCRSFDHENLFVVDALFFPSSAAVNPDLTFAAPAIRVDHIAKVDFGVRGMPRLRCELISFYRLRHAGHDAKQLPF